MTVRVETLSAGSPRAVASLDAPTLVCTLGSEVVAVEGVQSGAQLDRTRWCLLPAGFSGQLRSLSATGHLFLAEIHPPLMRRVARDYAGYGLPLGEVIAICEELRVMPRTTWVHELVHRHWWELRARGARAVKTTTSFLEAEIVKEACYLVLQQREGGARAPHGAETLSLVERARREIDDDLLRDWTVGELARRVAASESTLLRAFQRELGVSPGRYVRERRLDEAFVMLQSGARSVHEIAMHVRYRSAAAFADAFRRRFGRAPSDLRRPPT